MHTQLLRVGGGGVVLPTCQEGAYGLDQQGHVFKDRPVWGQYVDVSDTEEQVTWRHDL